MRWRWEGRDLPSLDERSSPSPPCPHPMLRVETRPWGAGGGVEADWTSVDDGGGVPREEEEGLEV